MSQGSSSRGAAPVRPSGGRRHETIGHTADVGIRVSAPDPWALLEESAAALADLIADRQTTGEDAELVAIAVSADDLAGLGYAWLSELVSLSDARGQALVDARVDDLRSTAGGWSVRGMARFLPYGPSVEARTQVKAATFHRMRVEQEPGGWWLEAFFDV